MPKVEGHAIFVFLSEVYGVEGSSRRNISIIVLWLDVSTTLNMTETVSKTLVKHTYSDASFVSMTKTA